MRNRVGYSKEMRERASANGKTLGSVDCEIDGCRHTSQGPTTEAQAAFLLSVSVALFCLDDEGVKALTRSVKTRVKKSQEANRG